MESASVGSPRRRLVGRLQQKRAGAEAEAASAVPGSRRGVNEKEGTSLWGEREKEKESVRGARTLAHTHAGRSLRRALSWKIKSNSRAANSGGRFVSKKGRGGGLRREREKRRSRNLYLLWRKERGVGERVAEVEGGRSSDVNSRVCMQPFLVRAIEL